MRRVGLTNRYIKNYKLAQKRGKDMAKLHEIIKLLVADVSLPARCHPHKLSGQYNQYWECHIEPDWLLIYDASDANKLVLHRLGIHADLFD